MTRLIVVDDHAVMRAGVIALLAGERTIELVGEAGDGRTALALVERHQPDVALVDLRMPGLDGVATTTEIVARHPPTRVLILTTYDTDDDIETRRRGGRDRLPAKDTTREQLVDAIHAAARGETVSRATRRGEADRQTGLVPGRCSVRPVPGPELVRV